MSTLAAYTKQYTQARIQRCQADVFLAPPGARVMERTFSRINRPKELRVEGVRLRPSLVSYLET